MGLHRSVRRGHLCAFEYVSKLERPPGFPTLMCESTSPQLQCVYDRLHLRQTSDAASCCSAATSTCAMSRHNECEQGPPRNLQQMRRDQGVDVGRVLPGRLDAVVRPQSSCRSIFCRLFRILDESSVPAGFLQQTFTDKRAPRQHRRGRRHKT